MADRRKLKVYGKSLASRDGVPQIALQGQWLEKYGFKVGDFVAVDCEEGRLVITHREPEEREKAKIEDRIGRLSAAQKKQIYALLDELEEQK